MGFVSSNPERNQFYAVKTLNKISPLPFSGLKIKSVKVANKKKKQKPLNNNKETIKRFIYKWEKLLTKCFFNGLLEILLQRRK